MSAAPADWEIAPGEPAPRLREHVHRLVGFTETPRGPVRRREPPSVDVPLIVSFGAPYRVTTCGGGEGVAPREGFVGGLSERYATTETTGPAACVQLDVTPVGAYLLLGVPMSELTGRVVGLGDVFGAEAARLAERLHDAAGWGERFALVQSFAAARMEAARPASPGVLHALRRLRETGGTLDVRALAAEVGWSRKHLAARFHEQVGLAPKAVARIFRFRRALRVLESAPPGARWSEVALRCGYYDQAHFNRDFRGFTGTTPGEYLRARLGDGLNAFLE